MRKLRQDHNLWTQSLLLTARHQPHLQAQPAKDVGDGKGTCGAQGALHQVYQGVEQVRSLRFNPT